MSFLKKNIKKFYTILIDNNSCKIYFRNISPRRKVLEEETKNIYIKNKNFPDEIKKFIKDEENSHICVLQTSKEQGLASQDCLDMSKYLLQSIDTDVISYANLKDINEIRNSFDFKVDEFISPFKVLYFLYKNSALTNTSLYVVKFNETMAIMVANKNRVIDTKMVDLSELYVKFYNDDLVLNSEELFLEVLKRYVDEFYKNHDEFIDKIYIYSSDDLGVEMGYYIFTKIFIRTEVSTLNLMDFINKINIKENF